MHHPPGRRAPESGNRAFVAGLAWFAVALLVLIAVRDRYWWIGGDDGWYHIRLAAELRRRGTLYLDTLPFVRLSVFTEGWGDKELLFHWLLIPFAGGDLLTGAKVALSVINGLVVGVVAWSAVRLVGRAGWLAPVLLLAINTHFPVRMDQLRPAGLSLALLLLLAQAIIARRRWPLFAIGALYPLTYTAWQAPILLAAATFAAFAVLRRDPRWELLWVPLAGVALGILVHPGFPDNARIWALQNVAFFRQRGSLPVGTEIFSEGVVGFLRSNWTGLVALVLLALARRPRWRNGLRDADLVMGVFAATTLVLFLLAIRFAEYAVPFACLFGLLLYHDLEPRPFVARLGRAGRAAPWGLVAFGGMFLHVRETVAVMRINHRYAFQSIADIDRFGAAIPPGATVASTWDFTPFYFFAAPRASYLNVLDPVFMAVRYPAQYDTLERIHEGVITDVPAALSAGLGSDYIAWNAVAFPALARRAQSDPRLVPVFTSVNHQVARVDHESDHGFVTDWRIDTIATPELDRYLAKRETTPAAAMGAPYDPRAARALVDPPPGFEGSCWWASRRFPPTREPRLAWFSSSGPAVVFRNGQRIHASEEGNAGVIDAVRLDPGTTPADIAVFTCADRTFGNGFFWRTAAPGQVARRR